MKNINNNDELKSLPIRLPHKSETTPLHFLTTVKQSSDNRILISVSATDTSDNSFFAHHQRTIMDLGHWQQIAQLLENRTECEYIEKHTNRPESLAHDSTVFDAALRETLAGRGRINYVWAESTEKIAIQNYTRLCKYLVNYLPVDEFSEDVHRYIEQAFCDSVRQHGNSGGNQDTMENSAHTALRYGVVVYQVVREFWNDRHPEKALPEIDWQLQWSYHIANPEQFKELDDEIRKNFCLLLRQEAATSPALVKSAVLMMLSLRTAEAAAITMEQIDFAEDYCIISVLQQVQNAKVTKRLKTENGYRILPAPKWHTELLRKCFEELKRKNMDGFIPAEHVSDWVYRKLERCGCTKEMFSKASRDMSGKLDADSISAYILRRDFASLAKNTMGFSKDEIDFFLGHKTKFAKKNLIDYRLPENRQKLLAKLERYVFDPELTLNPAYHPIELSHGDDLALLPYRKIKLKLPDYATHHTLTIRASEPGDTVVVHFPAGTEIDQNSITVTSTPYDPTVSSPVV